MIHRPECLFCGQSGEVSISISSHDNSYHKFIESYYVGRAEWSYFDEPLRILHCTDCDVYWHEYILAERGMRELYDSWIDTQESYQKTDTWGNRHRWIREASTLPVWFTDDQPSTLRVLDYGMGWGSYLEAAAAYGCEVHGYELSDVRAEHARSRGTTVHESLDSVHEHRYDIIMANQVLEHVPNPDEVLSTLRDLVHPDGLCYIATPTVERAPTRESVFQHGPFHPPEHIQAFTPSGLRHVMGMHGFQQVIPNKQLIDASVRGVVYELARRFLSAIGQYETVASESAGYFKPTPSVDS